VRNVTASEFNTTSMIVPD